MAGIQAKITQLACEVLKDIGAHPSTRQWKSKWPNMPRLCPPPFFDLRTNPHKIGFVCIDMGATVKHTTHKLRRLHRRLVANGSFRALCDHDQCLLVLITGSEGKANALRHALQDQGFFCPVDVLIHPDLFDYILKVKS